jgi:hypothetical protein
VSNEFEDPAILGEVYTIRADFNDGDTKLVVTCGRA